METTKIVAACGLDCAACGARKAWITNDESIRKATAEEWSRMFGANIPSETINCSGCLDASGPKFSHCAECEIRSCVQSKKVANCGKCASYPECERIAGFIQQAPYVKPTLDAERVVV